MNVFRGLNAILAVINAGIRRVAAFIRNRSNKSKSVQDGFHVNRAGKVIYPRGYRSYLRKLAKYGRSQTMRMGPPVLTGKRLERVAKSCCPANQIKNFAHGPCTCGQHYRIPEMGGLMRTGDLWVKRIPCDHAEPCGYVHWGRVEDVTTVGRADELRSRAAAAGHRDNVISIDEVFAKALQPVVPS